MKKYFNYLAFAMVAACSLAFVSCSDDDDEPKGGNTNPDVSAELVLNHVGRTGWSGNADNGVLTYVPYDADEYGDDWQPYYAFDFTNGVCQDAVFGLICESTYMAQQLERLFKTGAWADMDDDDDDDYYDYAALRKMQSRLKKVTRAYDGYNLSDLALTVYRNGKTIYITVDCLVGKDNGTVRKTIDIWQGNDSDLSEILIGKWDDANNRYINNNIYGINTKYQIDTEFANNLLKKYMTTITFPNKTWAALMFENLEEQNEQIGDIYGLYPQAELNGRVVTEDAVIIGDITKAQTLEIIAALDILMSQPFITMLVD